MPASFHQTISFYISALSNYTLPQLLAKPSPNSWSMGQLYMHLIENTDWFFDQVKTCLSTNENQNKDATVAGKEMLLNNSFPNLQLEGPPENELTEQPDSIEDLLTHLNRKQEEIDIISELVAQTTFKGKTQHPGLGFFSAVEWFRFAEMHLRHHFRQKKRIDEYLQSNNLL